MAHSKLTTSVHRYWTTDPAEAIRLRMGHDGMAAEDAVTICEGFNYVSTKFPNHPALVFENQDTKEWQIVTYSDYKCNVRHFAKAFIKLGLDPHHSVGILAFNSPQWFYSEMAAIFAGGLAAGIYTTNSAEAVCSILLKARTNIVIVDDQKQMDKVRSIRDQLPLLKAVVQLNGPFNPELKQQDGYYTWMDLIKMGVQSSEEEYIQRQSKIEPNQAAVVVFTSGTSGMPKGVLLSHDNLMWNAKQLHHYFRAGKNEVLVSYLPLSHVVGQCLDIFFSFYAAATVYFADPNALKGTLVNTLRVARPTRFMGVPRVFEKLQAAMLSNAKESFVKRHLLNWATSNTLKYHLSVLEGHPKCKWQYELARKTVVKKVKVSLGLDRCENFTIGAAPTTIELKKFFLSFDMLLMEVFGMSETAGPICLHDLACYRLDSLGRAMPGTQIKILNPDEDGNGEVLVRGRHVFMGYIGEMEKTREALDEDGWLHSGDIGSVDGDGFCQITGRIKELIITAGGENIPPVHIEDLVKKELPCVSNAFLVGDHRKYLTMLITLKTEMDVNSGAPLDLLSKETIMWLKDLGVTYSLLSEVIAAGPCPKVLEGIEAGISRANKNSISNAQKVQKFQILDHDFSIATGELGPTLKLKRNVVVKMYADIIDKMYE